MGGGGTSSLGEHDQVLLGVTRFFVGMTRFSEGLNVKYLVLKIVP